MSNLKNAIRQNLIHVIGVILYVVGIVSITYYPSQSHKTYMSENALMPGTARVPYEYQDSHQVSQTSLLFDKYIQSLSTKNSQSDSIVSSNDKRRQLSNWIYNQLTDMGIESYQHTFTINNYNSGNESTVEVGFNIYSVLRAPKSDGTESLLLSTRYYENSDHLKGEELSSVGLILNIAKHLHQKGRQWLAKDIILVITDGHFENGMGMRQWLQDYHSDTISKQEFPRAGMIQAALNLDISKSYNDKFHILAEGSNGQLPNLDLINTIGRLVMREGVSDRVTLSLKQSELVRDYVPLELQTLFTFMLNQAIGVPTGDHGLFNKYHIDAVTISLSGSTNAVTTLKYCKIIIGTFRSLNNLLEHLHQSFYYYLLPTPFNYVSIGEYMVSLGLILSPLIIRVLLLLVSLSSTFKPPSLQLLKSKNQQKSNQASEPGKEKQEEVQKKSQSLISSIIDSMNIDSPNDILYSATIVVITLLIGIAFFSIPLTFSNTFKNLFTKLSSLGDMGEGILFITFIIIYFIIFIIVFPLIDKYIYRSAITLSVPSTYSTTNQQQQNITRYRGGSSLLVFSILPVVLFLSSMSLFNFSFSTIAAIFIVPLCILPNQSKSRVLCTFQTVILMLLFSPPVILYAFTKYYLHQNVYDFINVIISQYQLFSTLLYPFITLVYIPFHILTITIVNSKINNNNDNNNYINEKKTN